MFEKSERLQVFECEPSKVVVPEGRIRKEFDPKKLRDLADSLKNPGMNQLQAGICYLSEGRPILVAGERRLRACTLAGVPFCFTLQNETDELTIREVEIEENLNRVNFNWFEEVSAKEELHKIRQMRGGVAVPGSKTGVSIRDTAQELGVSYGNLAEDVELAQFAQQIPEVRAAKSKTEAKKIVKRLKEQVTRHVVLERAKKSAETKGEFKIIQKGEKSPEEHLAEQAAFFTQKILRGTMEEQLSALPDETFHLVIFDPPWGVSYDKVSANAGDKEMYEDSPEVFDANISNWLRLIYQKMAPNSHLYMFFGIVNYQRVYESVEEAGFTTNRIPILWHKVGSHRTRNPDIWPGRCYEPIVYARKGNKNLIEKGMPDIIATRSPGRGLKLQHPSAKHPDIYVQLLKRSCMPGDRVLDPMCGSGMLGVACEYLRPSHYLDWTEIEVNENFCDLSLANVIVGYHGLIKQDMMEEQEKYFDPSIMPFYECYSGHTGRTEELLDTNGQKLCPDCGKGVTLRSRLLKKNELRSWEKLQPETQEWESHWREHPEDQDDMFKWRMREGK